MRTILQSQNTVGGKGSFVTHKQELTQENQEHCEDDAEQSPPQNQVQIAEFEGLDNKQEHMVRQHNNQAVFEKPPHTKSADIRGFYRVDILTRHQCGNDILTQKTGKDSGRGVYAGRVAEHIDADANGKRQYKREPPRDGERQHYDKQNVEIRIDEATKLHLIEHSHLQKHQNDKSDDIS